jgi:hypothetical protein
MVGPLPQRLVKVAARLHVLEGTLEVPLAPRLLTALIPHERLSDDRNITAAARFAPMLRHFMPSSYAEEGPGAGRPTPMDPPAIAIRNAQNSVRAAVTTQDRIVVGSLVARVVSGRCRVQPLLAVLDLEVRYAAASGTAGRSWGNLVQLVAV